MYTNSITPIKNIRATGIEPANNEIKTQRLNHLATPFYQLNKGEGNRTPTTGFEDQYSTVKLLPLIDRYGIRTRINAVKRQRPNH